MKRRDALHHAAEKIGCGALAVDLLSAVPDSDFVDLDVLDRFGLELDEFFQFFDEEHFPGGVRIAVATGKPTVFSEQILEHFGLRQYIDVVSGIPLDREPPDKCEVILHALYEMGISDRSGCVMVGDRSHDAIGAKMARIDFIGVLYGYGSREELEAEGTDAIADSVAALRSLLFS